MSFILLGGASALVLRLCVLFVFAVGSSTPCRFYFADLASVNGAETAELVEPPVECGSSTSFAVGIQRVRFSDEIVELRGW